MFRKKRPKERSIIFGRQPLLEALQSNVGIEKIVLKKNLQGENIKEIMALAKAQHIPIQMVPVEKLNWYTQKNHQGVLAHLSAIEYANLEDILSHAYAQGELPLFLILDQVSDVRNFGAIARTALCMGVHALVISSKGSAAINEEALKTSAGALVQLPVCRSKSLGNTLDYLQSNGLSVLAMDLKGENVLDEVDLKVPLAIVMGSEGDGIQRHLLNKADLKIKIPMTGKFDSLNVSVASGMVLYEVVRQRRSL